MNVANANVITDTNELNHSYRVYNLDSDLHAFDSIRKIIGAGSDSLRPNHAYINGDSTFIYLITWQPINANPEEIIFYNKDTVEVSHIIPNKGGDAFNAYALLFGFSNAGLEGRVLTSFPKMQPKNADSLLLIADGYFNSCNRDSAEYYYIKACEACGAVNVKKLEYINRQRAELRIPEYCMHTHEKVYKNFIHKADSAFSAKEYEQAKEYYYRACTLNPEDKYACDRIKQCENLLK